MDWQAIILTLKLAMLTTIILVVVGTPLAWWLAKKHRWYKGIVSSIVALPLVLPPTVIGFYLLLALGPQGFVGQLTEKIGLSPLPFTFWGLVLGSVIYSMPFVVQPLRNAFMSIGKRPMEVAATLGCSPIVAFFTVALPQSRYGYISAIVLGFAHTVGEFGVVLMIGGAIPGETKVLSIAIYDHVDALEWGAAHSLSAGLLLFSFVVVFAMYGVEKRLAYYRNDSSKNHS